MPAQADTRPGAAAFETLALGAAVTDPEGTVAALRNTLARGAQQAAEVFSVPLATATFQTPATGLLQCRAGLPQWASRKRGVPAPDGAPAVAQADPVLAQVLATGEPLVVPDLARDPAFADALEAHFDGLSFCAAAPLRSARGVVVGMLAVHDTVARPFTPKDLELLAEMADRLSDSLAEQASLEAASKAASEAAAESALEPALEPALTPAEPAAAR